MAVERLDLLQLLVIVHLSGFPFFCSLENASIGLFAAANKAVPY